VQCFQWDFPRGGVGDEVDNTGWVGGYGNGNIDAPLESLKGEKIYFVIYPSVECLYISSKWRTRNRNFVVFRDS